MSAALPHQVVLLAVGAFLLGWILASISARLSGRYAARKRDPRDDRIRSLEADHRVAQVSAEGLRSRIESSGKELQAARDETAKRDGVIRDQQAEIDKLTSDLRDSVRKTRELREELRDRATENLRSEAKQRELETELSIAQASTDFIATGVLDYSFTDEEDEGRTAPGRRAPGAAR